MMGKYESRRKHLLETAGVVASIICAVKAVIDILRDIWEYRKQKSNRQQAHR